MDFGGAIKSGFRNYVKFSGRSSRSEYWYWFLFTFITGICLGILDVALFPGVIAATHERFSPLNDIFSLVTLIPWLALGSRRLHDINRTGWWQLIILTIIGIIPIIYWACQPSDPQENRYGAPPLNPAA
jgi:uncharacterized membrane protein YhaH (DUF805 family)